MRRPKTWKQFLILAAILAAVYAWDRWIEPGGLSGGSSNEGSDTSKDGSGTSTGTGTATASDPIRAAFDQRRKKVWIEGAAVVVKKLADDNEGSRHQKFLMRSPGGVTVLVAHNIDVAPRVPLSEGDNVSYRGEYIWTEKGGTLHWTHRDNRGSRRGGWIEHEGTKYR